MSQMVALQHQQSIQKSIQNFESTSGIGLGLIRKANKFALGCIVLYAIANLPVADAVGVGAQSYIACIQLCVQSAGLNWVSSIVCPTICAPFLLAPV
jgi:hypothetical protein